MARISRAFAHPAQVAHSATPRLPPSRADSDNSCPAGRLRPGCGHVARCNTGTQSATVPRRRLPTPRRGRSRLKSASPGAAMPTYMVHDARRPGRTEYVVRAANSPLYAGIRESCASRSRWRRPRTCRISGAQFTIREIRDGVASWGSPRGGTAGHARNSANPVTRSGRRRPAVTAARAGRRARRQGRGG